MKLNILFTLIFTICLLVLPVKAISNKQSLKYSALGLTSFATTFGLLYLHSINNDINNFEMDSTKDPVKKAKQIKRLQNSFNEILFPVITSGAMTYLIATY